MYQSLQNCFRKHSPHKHGHIDQRNYKLLDDHVKQGATTLETGSGLSTLFFATRSLQHISIAPFGPTFYDKLQLCADELGISLDPVSFINGKSDEYLPQSELPRLDFVLIDGGHEFPIPIIDWYYTRPSLKVGGYVMVDDLGITSCGMLHRFLMTDESWELMDSNNKCSVFRKKKEFDSFAHGWLRQKYNSNKWNHIKIHA